MIDSSLKTIATERMDGFGDNSAPRATLRAIQVNNELLLISANVQLMALNKCPPLAEPITGYEYVAGAISCATARLKGVTKPPECERDKWERASPAAK